MKQQQGYILITSTIIIFSIGSLAAFSILFFSVSAAKNNLTMERSSQARGVADACAELAVQRIVSTPSFTGGGGSNIGLGTCSYAVTQPTTLTKLVVATGVVNNVFRKVQISFTLSPITITSWQEVP